MCLVDQDTGYRKGDVKHRLQNKMIMFLFGLLLTLSQVCKGFTGKDVPGLPELPGLEAEFSADTDSCVEASRIKHKNNPNAGLDHFLNCLLKHVNTVSIFNSHFVIQVMFVLLVAGKRRKSRNR